MESVHKGDRDGGSGFGDYVARELLGESTSTRSWLAEQESVGRMVLIEELKPEAMRECEGFMADVRAKAAVEHPLVGSIYEASTENGRCFFAHELLPGETLGNRRDAGEKIAPLAFVHILRKVSEANLYHETHDNATFPMDSGAIHVDTQGVVRIKNLAVSGSRLPDHSLRDVLRLGGELEGILDRGQPGATRCLTLLAWMRGEEVSQPLGWEKIREYCELIEQQLTEPLSIEAPPTSAIRPEKRSGFVAIVAILLAVILVAVFLVSKKKKPEIVILEKPVPVKVAAGDYPGSDGSMLKVESFRISAYEVTIGEYATFLETLGLLSGEGEEKTFDHPEQPKEKPGHDPDGWNLIHPAALAGAYLNGREMALDLPVVGVDWWDAYAYAMWKRGFLPTAEQWQAAVHSGTGNPSAILVSEWIPVTEETEDRTSNGIQGMAGSVSEWTSEQRPSPSNPLGAPLWVIAGGSYLHPARGALSLDWVDDRSLRRQDLGFRLCLEAQ